MKHKLISLCLVLWITATIPLMASAQRFDYEKQGSMSISLTDADKKTPVEGVELSIYYVATVGITSDNNLAYTYTPAFADIGIEIDNPSLAKKLNTFVEKHSLASEKIVTDSQGKAGLSGLPLGLYFVKQTNSVQGYAQLNSFMITVPYKDGNNFIYDVNASPKTEMEKLVDITVKKVWNTDKSAKIAENVTIQLLRDGVVVETAILGAENNWKVTFNNMPQSDSYTVEEVNIPKGFVATYSRDGYEFTVTNTATLIKTGQLVWPIPILAMAGIAFITLGTVVLHKQEDFYE